MTQICVLNQCVLGNKKNKNININEKYERKHKVSTVVDTKNTNENTRYRL